LAFIRHETDFDVTADVAVRVDAVEELVNASTPYLPAKIKNTTATVGADLGNLDTGAQRRWTIADKADIEAVASAIVSDFLRIGIPYFDRFHDLDTLFSMLRRNDQEAWLHCAIHHARCMRAVALAVVLKRREVRSLIEAEAAFLSKRNDFGLAEFEQFASAVTSSA
jgi:hypothetical protein